MCFCYFSGQYKSQVHDTFAAAAKINSLVNSLNYKLEKKGYTINAGIGLSWGRVLMIKAGYNGSGFNDVVWLGDSVNKKSKMCSKVMKEVQYPMVVTKDFYDNLDEDAQKWFTPSPHLFSPEFYYGDIVNIEMRDWLNEQKEKDRRSIHLNKLNLYYRELI